MKNLIVLFVLSLLLPNQMDAHSPWSKGSKLNVFATSGLKLRAFPSLQAEVLDVVRYGDQVTVLNTFDFSEQYAERIDWIDGHWIFVEFEGLAGYLFDGYLSDLDFPGSENELCSDGYSYAYTLSAYLEQNYLLQHRLDSSLHKDIRLLDYGIKIKRIFRDTSEVMEIEMPGFKINEVLNLMRSMVPDRQGRVLFEKSLLFQEGISGEIEKITVNFDNPVTLQKKQNGNLLVKASGISGC